MRIYDQPNHPQYGPVRRAHLILMYLYGDNLAKIEPNYRAYTGVCWDDDLAFEVGNGTVPEARAARRILSIFQMLAIYQQV